MERSSLLSLLAIVLLLQGCATAVPRQEKSWVVETERPSAAATGSWYSPLSWFEAESGEEDLAADDDFALDSATLPDDASDAFDIKSLLYSQLREWRSVRYKLGGMSKRGVDCSAYVYLTYRDKLGIKLPRVVRDQSGAGRTITQAELAPGDLVFFQIDRRTRHVGIYLEDRKFMHASLSKGVTVSSLDNRYWSKRYWKAVRVPEALLAMRSN